MVNILFRVSLSEMWIYNLYLNKSFISKKWICIMSKETLLKDEVNYAEFVVNFRCTKTTIRGSPIQI